jgi:hypothetical protein
MNPPSFRVFLYHVHDKIRARDEFSTNTEGNRRHLCQCSTLRRICNTSTHRNVLEPMIMVQDVPMYTHTIKFGILSGILSFDA